MSELRETCKTCGGDGEVDVLGDIAQCEFCEGLGTVEVVDLDSRCQVCNGKGYASGRLRSESCRTCDGTGKRPETLPPSCSCWAKDDKTLPHSHRCGLVRDAKPQDWWMMMARLVMELRRTPTTQIVVQRGRNHRNRWNATEADQHLLTFRVMLHPEGGMDRVWPEGRYAGDSYEVAEALAQEMAELADSLAKNGKPVPITDEVKARWVSAARQVLELVGDGTQVDLARMILRDLGAENATEKLVAFRVVNMTCGRCLGQGAPADNAGVSCRQCGGSGSVSVSV